MNFTKKIKVIVFLLLLLLLSVWPASGWCMTPDETSGYKMIPIAQWQMLSSELMQQKDDLNLLQLQLQKVRRPSEQLLQELQKVKEQLQKSQAELMSARISLTDASKELAESKTSLQTLRQAIDKERRVHRRQVWQNRIWCIILGAAAGCAAAK